MIFCSDIDGTICTKTNGKYEEAQPLPQVIAKLNQLYDAGQTVKYYTARGATSGKDWSELTRQQLKDWGVKYHELILGKPSADYYIEDKHLSLDNLEKILAALAEKEKAVRIKWPWA